jgi:hypothetical protein
MPWLHNPTQERLPCPWIGRLIDPYERVEITDEQAKALEHNAIFRVEQTAPKRETPKRGGKHVQERETRVRGMTTGNSLPK